MSQVRIDFFNSILPYFDKGGFKFYISKNRFIKKENGFTFIVSFKFDGRGGLNMIDWIEYSIEYDEISKILKSQFGKYFDYTCLRETFDVYKTSKSKGIEFIPVMYSQTALDLANNSNLKALSELSYHEKYPKERIDNCVRWVTNFLNEKIIPYFLKYNTLTKILEVYSVKNPQDSDLNPLEIGRWDSGELHFSRLMFFNLMCAKLNIEKPDIIMNYQKHKFGKDEEVLKRIEVIENYKF